jgi:phage tail-like protein
VRGLIPVPANPLAVAAQLPGIYQGEFVVDMFCAALDEVLAPVVLTLDSLPAYLDPQTAPPDMLAWLAGWVGIDVVGAPSVEEQRKLVRDGAEMLRWRGTARGLRAAIVLETGLDAEITETGASDWSSSPGAELPGEAGNRVIVRVTAADPDLVDAARIAEIVIGCIPAHVGHRVEVVAAPAAAG